MNQETKRKEVAQKSLFNSESAALTAVAAVLLLGLAFTIISVVKLNHVPEWKIDAERDYSYDAWSNMEEVKTRGDIFTRFMESDANYPYGLSATVPFGMGGGEIPVFEPSKSNGKLTVNTEGCTMIIALSNHTTLPYPVKCGGITYYSENRQYPDQVFRYENGALILAQGNNSQMKRNPLFSIQENSTSGNYTVTINAINLTGEPASISSNTFTAIRLTGCLVNPVLDSHDYGDVDSFNLTIFTRYTDAWATYLNDTAKDAGLEYNTDYTIESIPNSDYVYFSFNKLDRLYVNETILHAELGGGGILTGDTVMKLGKWYNFNKVSDSTVSLSKFENYDSTTDFSVDTTENDEILTGYSYNDPFEHNLKNSPLELTFGFSSYTKFESKPTSATIRMIYSLKNPSGTMNVAGNPLDLLSSSNSNKWHLYNETTPIDITDPSELTFNLEIYPQNTNISIDYLAVRLE